MPFCLLPPATVRTRGLLLCLLMLPAWHAGAVTSQDTATLQRLAEYFLQRQSASLPGKVELHVERPEARMPPCAAPEAFQPAGARPMGKTTVGVRCLSPSRWTVYLPARVRVQARYVVLRQPVPANHILSATDLQLRDGDLGELPADVLTDPATLEGYRTVSGLAAGAALRAALLRPPQVVQQGQTTRLQISGPGFLVQSQGQALANAARGERVRVKTLSGQVVSGIAREGQQVFVEF